MEDSSEDVRELLKLKKSYKKKLSVTRYQEPRKNTFRRIRRKRSKVRYRKSLKQLRYNRKTDDLCSAVEVFDITDMEWAPSCSSSILPTEVTEWQKQEQIAYWKSRAISLELENKMLHQHLRNVYAKTIEQYLENNKCIELHSEKPETRQEENQCSKNTIREKSGISKTKRPVSPKEPSGKHRLEEMKAIYGDKAQKIMGMETALQLNYEKHFKQLNPSHWPSIPLRLKFD
ncbi:gem-associated protein 8-like [Anoplophora glabripennis]|uniref:gem-associated protein 8-like n=1 Tax=Anoplophora glabripennis TaxID=217634 RepID=UPI0008750F08|nr:gem-associated protein 8-like [Anoplophora glabripennis]